MNDQSSVVSRQSSAVNWFLSPGFILVLYTLLTLILTYPLFFNLNSTVPNDIGDPLLNTWILAWDAHALLTDPLNLFNANIYHSLPNTLAYSEHMLSTALLAIPLQLITAEPVLTYNLSLLATFPLAAFGMYLLALRWTGQHRAAFIAGLIFAFAPYRFAAIAHLQLLTFQWLPFVILFLDRIAVNCQRPALSKVEGSAAGRSFTPPHLYLALAIFLLLQVLASWYLAIYTALILGIFLFAILLTGRLHHRASLPRLALTLLICSLLILPFVWPYLTLINELREARPPSQALSLAAVLTDFAAAAPFNQLFGPLTASLRTRPGFTEENTLFVGLIAPVLALVSLLALLTGGVLRTARSVLPLSRHPSPHQRHKSEMQQVAPSSSSAPPSSPLRVSPPPSSPAPHPPLLIPPSSSPPPRSSLLAPRSTLLALLTILILSLILTFPTPYAILARLIPLTTIIRVPPRWIIPALFALTGLAACGYTLINEKLIMNKLPRSSLLPALPSSLPPSPSPLLPPRFSLLALRSSLLAPRFNLKSAFLLVLFTLLLLFETLSTPLPLATVENRTSLNPAYSWLAHQAQSSEIVLIELPLHSAPAPEFPEVKRLYASTLGWWRLVNGYSGYTPPRQPKLAQALATFPDEQSIMTLQTLATSFPPSPSLLTPPSSLLPPPDPSLIAPRSSLHPTPNSQPLFLLIHPGEAPLDRSQWETRDRWQAERNPTLYPHGQFKGDYLYQVLPPDPSRFPATPLATFGPGQTIRLLRANVELASTTPDPTPNTQHATRNTFGHPRLILFWQPTAPLPTDYTVFIHLRAADGFVRSQADAPPVGNHYPTTAWQPDEIIQDIHLLPGDEDLSQVNHLAIGLYDPVTGERLPAFGPDGARLTDEAVIVPLR